MRCSAAQPQSLAAPPATDRLLDSRAVARRLGITVRTLWRHVAAGEAPPPVIRRRGGKTRWRESDVQAFIAALTPVRP